MYRVYKLAAQLLARGVLLSSVPATISYEPPIWWPGETPTEPLCTTVLAPLKLTEVPAKIAKFAQSPSARGTSATAIPKDLLAAGSVIVEPLSHEMAVRANALPFNVALVSKLMALWAKMFPTKLLYDPRVTEVPIAQKTFWIWAPFWRMNDVVDAVVRAVPTWKMNWAAESPWPSRVRVAAENFISLAEQ